MTEWQTKKLGDLAVVLRGSTITRKEVTPGEVPVIAGGQTPSCYHNVSNRDGKTITVSASGAYAGFLQYFEIPIFASDCSTIKVKDENQTSSKFLFYMLQASQTEIYAFQRGSGQPHVYPSQLVGLDIPTPPIDEQHKIVELLEDHLSRLDVALSDVKQAKLKAAQFRRSLLQSIFVENLVTNTNRSLSITFDDAFEIGKTARKALKQRDYLHYGEFPVIDQGEEFISGYSDEKSLVLDFKRPVIIFGDHTRRIKYVNFPFIAGADGTKILMPNVELDSVFACYQLQSKELRDKGYARHFSELRKEKFWIPPMNEQLKIVEHLDEHFLRLNTTASLVETFEKQAIGLKRSLLQAAFTGQLTKGVEGV